MLTRKRFSETRVNMIRWVWNIWLKSSPLLFQLVSFAGNGMYVGLIWSPCTKWGLMRVSPVIKKERRKRLQWEHFFFYQKRKICYINNIFFLSISRKLYSKEALKKWLTELQYRQTHPHTKGPKQQGKHKKTFSLIANTPNL